MLDDSAIATQDGAPVSSSPVSLDRVSTVDNRARRGVTGKIRENGSKLLSLIGIQKNHGPDQRCSR